MAFPLTHSTLDQVLQRDVNELDQKNQEIQNDIQSSRDRFEKADKERVDKEKQCRELQQSLNHLVKYSQIQKPPSLWR